LKCPGGFAQPPGPPLREHHLPWDNCSITRPALVPPAPDACALALACASAVAGSTSQGSGTSATVRILLAAKKWLAGTPQNARPGGALGRRSANSARRPNASGVPVWPSSAARGHPPMRCGWLRRRRYLPPRRSRHSKRQPRRRPGRKPPRQPRRTAIRSSARARGHAADPADEKIPVFFVPVPAATSRAARGAAVMLATALTRAARRSNAFMIVNANGWDVIRSTRKAAAAPPAGTATGHGGQAVFFRAGQ
jgi:hypothetical protein